MNIAKDLTKEEFEKLEPVWTSEIGEADRILIKGTTRSLVAKDIGFVYQLSQVDNNDLFETREAYIKAQKDRLYKQGELIGYYESRRGRYGVAVVLQDRNKSFSIDVLIGDEITTLMREETFRVAQQ